ncbi:MAG: L,D-transpeptidase [Labilithrix sp.]|nr:L,D-transpeptidase [Labilithrix sp.]MCW5836678.1 L,D-transpeptidase [Labilithrix sp.]
MISLSRWFVLAALPLAMSTLVGCAAEGEEEDVSDGEVTEDELRKGAAEQWVYNGTMPQLDQPSLTVSLTAHTARVTGFVPAGWNQPLPYYADTITEGGRTKVAVVYPIATGSSVNSQGTSYSISRVSPWVPTNSAATWGGFPFIPYNRGIAFHGPITASDGEWKLIRGPVSHGCNRMQGEHVTELAHLIGVDMTTTVHRGDATTGLNVPVTVIRKPDVWNGKQVDVNYPAARGVTRPTGPDVKMFPSWSADQLAAFVCPLNKRELNGSRTIPENYCARRYQNAFDPAIGPR